jgi:hypothetical protein
MEYEFSYSNIQIKIKYNKIVAIDALDIICLINQFFIVAFYRATYLVGYGQCSLRGTKFDLRVRNTVQWLYIGPTSTSSEVMCIAPTWITRILLLSLLLMHPVEFGLISGNHTSNYSWSMDDASKDCVCGRQYWLYYLIVSGSSDRWVSRSWIDVFRVK